MTAYSADHEAHVPLCDDCIHGGCITSGIPCDAEDCRCDCGICGDGSHRADRARELDDRPADKLAVIANELDRERYGNLRDLSAERHGG